jgi:ATP-binding cassette subfamily B protein
MESVGDKIWIGGLAVVTLTGLQGIFLFKARKEAAIASENIAKNIREELYDHIQHLPYDYHKNADTGDLIQRSTSDVETIRRFLSVQLMEVGRAIFMVSIALYFMLSLSLKMTVAAMVMTPVIFIFALIFFSVVQKAFKVSDETEAEMSSVIQENLNGTRVVRAFAREKYEIDKFKEKNRKYADKTYKMIIYLAYYWGISDFLCFISIGLVLVAGAYYSNIGEITLGTIIVFINYEYRLLWPIRQLGRILTDLGKAMVSAERIQEILDVERETPKAEETKPEVRGEIVFENVSFSYPDDRTRKVLADVSFTVQKGETVAVMGKTGSGKSSLVHLLARLYDKDSGRILIDGVEIENIEKKWLRRNIGLILQEPFLFSKTIIENINFDCSKSQKAVFDAAKASSVHDVIKEFDKGYETIVGEKGVTLSGGQKQRVAIARTLINDYPVLVFDDSLSAVDTETDIAIRNELSKRHKGITTFIISHRIASVYDADKIIVLEEGRVKEMGIHEELMEVGGYYNMIWKMQMKSHT